MQNWIYGLSCIWNCWLSVVQSSVLYWKHSYIVSIFLCNVGHSNIPSSAQICQLLHITVHKGIPCHVWALKCCLCKTHLIQHAHGQEYNRFTLLVLLTTNLVTWFHEIIKETLTSVWFPFHCFPQNKLQDHQWDWQSNWWIPLDLVSLLIPCGLFSWKKP